MWSWVCWCTQKWTYRVVPCKTDSQWLFPRLLLFKASLSSIKYHYTLPTVHYQRIIWRSPTRRKTNDIQKFFYLMGRSSIWMNIRRGPKYIEELFQISFFCWWWYISARVCNSKSWISINKDQKLTIFVTEGLKGWLWWWQILEHSQKLHESVTRFTSSIEYSKCLHRTQW